MLLTVTEAAEAAGVARSTLYRAIESGELTRAPDKRIDVAELVRVYGELRHVPGEEGEGGDTVATSADATPEAAAAAVDAGARADEAAWLRSLVDRQQATIEAQARELRESEERAATERRGLLAQLDCMTLLLPAPESEPPRGFLRRVLGR